MMINLVKLELSKKQISFQPDNFKDFSRREDTLPEEGDFQVTVVNSSDRFSSFQVELEVGDQGSPQGSQWYRVEPEICSKKPPGDRTVFTVTLLKSPVRSYDITLPITVRVLSVEVVQLTASDTLFLKVKRPKKELHAYLPIEDLTVYPGDRCKIPVLVYNLSATSRAVTIRLQGVDPTWLHEGPEQKLHLDAGESGESVFWCAPPPIASASHHKVYPLLLKASDDHSNTASTQGTLQVLPFGQVTVDCEEPQQTVPAAGRFWARPREPIQFDLKVHNQSNVGLRVHLEEHGSQQGRRLQPKMLPAVVPSNPDVALEPDATDDVPLQLKATRPWVGWKRTRVVDILPTLQLPGSGEDITQIPVQPSTQRLELDLLPRIPVWLQLGGGLLGLLLLLLIAWLWPRNHHRAPVTALTLMANGNTVISGSSDQTLRNWQVNPESWLPDRRRLKAVSLLTEPSLGKSVRTLRHLPAEVDRLAVGLENGEVQIWNIATRSASKSFFEDGRPDRVFALDFTQNSNLLFSGHGSGQVRLWHLAGDTTRPIQRLYPDSKAFAVSALTVVEQPDRYRIAAIGGQFNRLTLWLWDENRAFNLNYVVTREEPTAFTPVVSRQSYVTSLAGADTVAVMASADTQGFITLWDVDRLNDCMFQTGNSLLPRLSQTLLPPEALASQQRDVHGNVYADINIGDADCPNVITDQWQATSNGQAIRAVALTENGCYLSSVGDDGQVFLWPLNATHRRIQSHSHGIALKHYPRRHLNTVDIYRDTANGEDVVLVAHDIPSNRVQVHRRQVKKNDCQ